MVRSFKNIWRRGLYDSVFILIMAVISVSCDKVQVDSDNDNENDTIRLCVVSDMHVGSSEIFTDIASEIIKEDVGCIIATGDLVEGGKGATVSEFSQQLSEWKEITIPLVSKGIKILPLKGNHENDVRNGADLWKEFLSGYVPVDDGIMNYTYVYKDMLLVCLDNYNGEEKVDISWLEDELKRNRDKKVLIFGHEPAFKVFHEDCLDDDVQNRNDFWEILKRYNIRAYFCGHDHFLDVAEVSGIHQICSGTGGGWLMEKYSNYNGDNGNYTPHRLIHKSSYGYIVIECIHNHIYVFWKSLNYTEDDYVTSDIKLVEYSN